MFRRLLIWIMLIALPLQSYAAAGMIYCAPTHHAVGAVADSAHVHAEPDAHAHHHDDMAMADEHSDHDHSAPYKNGASKCSACSACCLGIAVIGTLDSRIHLPAGSPIMVARATHAHTSAILDGPQRPPRTTCV